MARADWCGLDEEVIKIFDADPWPLTLLLRNSPPSPTFSHLRDRLSCTPTVDKRNRIAYR